MNATRETVEPAMRAAAEDICPDHVDLIPPDTRNLMGFFMSLRKLMVEVCRICILFGFSLCTLIIRNL